MAMRRIAMTALWAVMAASTAVWAAPVKTLPTVSILGDSYSTYEGYIPEGNAIWYYDAEPQRERTDVDDVTQTWWWQFIKEGGYKLGVNDSYSGATICYKGYRGEDYEDRSFITRLPRLGSPDLILIFGGTNDSWAGAPAGEFKYDGQTNADLHTFRPAMALLLERTAKRYPTAQVLFIVNDGLREEITQSIAEICTRYGVAYVMLRDIDKKAGHPTQKGMRQIKEQVLEAIAR